MALLDGRNLDDQRREQLTRLEAHIIISHTAWILRFTSIESTLRGRREFRDVNVFKCFYLDQCEFDHKYLRQLQPIHVNETIV